jgi:iron complex outermembrane receptor protein
MTAKWKYTIILWAVIHSQACFLPDAKAAQPANSFDLSPEQLFSATVMSVSKTSEKLMDAPAAIYVLTNEDIMRSGATSIPEALRLVPGVQVARTHAGGWTVTVRGFASTGLGNKLLVLMDGREVYDQLFSGVYWDMQDTALEDIERIEVIRGPGGTLWGANAVNGVINIITKNAKDTQGGLVSAIAGNQDRAITTARYGGTFGSDVHYRAYAKYLNRDEERTVTDLGALDPQQAYRSGFRSDWHANGNDAFTLQGDVVKNDDAQIRIDPALVTNIEHVHATGWNMLGRWTRELPQDSRLSIQSYIDYTYRDQLLIADQRTTYDFDAQYELPSVGRHKIIAGGKYRLSMDKLIPSPFITTVTSNRNDQTLSGFVQDKITLDPGKWFLTLGSKFEHNDYSGFEMQPSGRLQWHIADNKMAWASVARAVRVPSQLEHDLRIALLQVPGFPAFDTGLIPNTHFNSEELVAYELGYRQSLSPSLTMDIAAFYNDYDNLVALMPVTGPFALTTLQYTNGTTAESYGSELTLNWRASDSLNFSTAYSLLNMQLHGPAGASNPEVAEKQSPQQQWNARSQWNIRNDLSFDTTLYYVDSLPDFHTKHYVRMDMGLGWKINERLQFNLVGQNLFAGSHTEFAPGAFTPTAEIEPSVYGKFTWRF